MSTSLASIRKSIAANVSQSREIRTLIHASHGPDRNAHWNDKRSLGADTRAYLLALAFLRDRPYERVESPTTVRHSIPTYIVARVIVGEEGTHGDVNDAHKAVTAWCAEKPATASVCAPASVAA